MGEIISQLNIKVRKKNRNSKKLKHGNDHKFECDYVWILIGVRHNRIDRTINREFDQREIGCQIF